MKRFFFLILVSASLFSSGCDSTKITIDEPKRVIRFINLTSFENEPFFRRNQEITKLVMDAIGSGKIFPYFIDYQNKASEELLTMEKFSNKISMETTIDGNSTYTTYLFAGDFHTLGFDQTVGTIEGKEYAQVHYVNFYANDDSKNEKSFKYRYSVRWNDFLSILNDHLDILYYTNSYSSWWRGDVFITHSNYLIDEGMTGKFISLSQTLPDFKAEDYRNKSLNYDLNKFKKEELTGGNSRDLFFIEQNGGNQYNLSKIVIEEIPEWFVYGNGDRYAFDWKEFQKIARDSSWRKSSEVFTLVDAIRLKKFHYSTEKATEEIKDGNFIKGWIDNLFGRKIINSFYTPSPKAFENFYTDYLEALFLGDPLNAHLHRPGHSIVELAHDYFLTGKIKAYRDDSLNTPITVDEFIKNTSEIIEAKEFDVSQKYKKGDTIGIEEKYLILLKDVKPSTYTNYDSLIKITKSLVPALYKPQQLVPLQLLQKITFDKEGKRKKYQLQGIGTLVPNNINIKGIEFPIGYFRWDELRKELLSDPRAMVDYKGKKVNLVNLFENREFFSALYKTGVLHSKDK